MNGNVKKKILTVNTFNQSSEALLYFKSAVKFGDTVVVNIQQVFTI